MVVVGCGGVGLSVVNGAAIAGAARIIAVDMLPDKLDMARKFGATDVVNAADSDAMQSGHVARGVIVFPGVGGLQ